MRERFLRTGFEGFANYEVIELLLTLCIPRRDVKKPAKALLKRFQSVRGVLDASPEELAEVEGLGQVAPVALSILRETATLYLQQSAEGRDVLNSSISLERFWRSRLGGLRMEVFEIAYLDSGFRLMPQGVQRLQTGTVDRAAVYPRQVVEAALKRSASVVVIAHNHPSGRAEPSQQDIALTRAIVDAGKLLHIKVLDHIIVAGETVFSFRQDGLLN